MEAKRIPGGYVFWITVISVILMIIGISLMGKDDKKEKKQPILKSEQKEQPRSSRVLPHTKIKMIDSNTALISIDGTNELEIKPEKTGHNTGIELAENQKWYWSLEYISGRVTYEPGLYAGTMPWGGNGFNKVKPGETVPYPDLIGNGDGIVVVFRDKNEKTIERHPFMGFQKKTEGVYRGTSVTIYLVYNGFLLQYDNNGKLVNALIDNGLDGSRAEFVLRRNIIN